MLLQLLFQNDAGRASSSASATSGNALPQLLQVTSYAILEVFLLCLVGYVLGKRGVIDAKTKRTLNLLNQACFTPCLLFGKVAFTLTPAKLAELWIVPVGFVIVSVVSALIAYLMGVVFRLSRSQRAFAIACATFMNSNSLPIGLMQSLTYTVDELHWGRHDTHEAMLGRALSYLVLFSTLGIILRWSYGIKLLSTADAAQDKPSIDTERQQPNGAAVEHNVTGNMLEADRTQSETEGLLAVDHAKVVDDSQRANSQTVPKSPRFAEGPRMTAPTMSAGRRRVPERRWTALGNAGDDDAIDPFHRPVIVHTNSGKRRIINGNWGREIDRYRSFPNTPAITPAASSYASSAASFDASDEEDRTRDDNGADEDSDVDVAGSGRRNKTEPSRSRSQAMLRRTRRSCQTWMGRWIVRPATRFSKGLQAFMTAPLYAALLSLIVACIPPLQSWLDQLTPVRGAIKSAGNCSVPITLLVLGSYFVAESPDASMSQGRASRRKSKHHQRQVSTSERLKRSISALFKNNATKEGDDNGDVTPSRPGEGRTIFVSVVSRMIVAPLVLIPPFWIWAKYTVNVADDPVFLVTATLVIGSAPAITLAQMTTAVGDSFERLISKVLFIAYAIVTFPSTILLVIVGLEMAKAQ